MTPVATRNTMLIAAAGSRRRWRSPRRCCCRRSSATRFDDSVQALWWLLPGTVALTGSKVLTSYIFSQGRPLVNTGITCVVAGRDGRR